MKRSAVLAVIGVLAACDGSESSSRARDVDYSDPHREVLTPVGILGVLGHPAMRTVVYTDGEGGEHHSGGFVVREIEPTASVGSAPSGKRLTPGDVIVRVADRSLPIKPDPTLDLVAWIEEEVSGGRESVALGYARSGSYSELTVRLDSVPLEIGYPSAVERFHTGARRALDHLVALQRDDGAFPTAGDDPSARVAVAAVAGIAFLAGGGGEDGSPYAAPLARCLAHVEGAFAEDAVPLDVWSLGFGVILLAESSSGTGVPDLERMQSRMSSLGLGLARLAALQGEEGGWPTGGPPEDEGPSESTLGTQHALLAMGVARRAGVSGDDDPVKTGLAFLKSGTHDGRAGVGSATGLDRRSEAGRAGGAAAALRALGCPERDTFLRDLSDVHARRVSEIHAGPVAVPLHLWNAAIAARQKGGGAWETFYDDCRHLLVSLQLGDGSCARLPRERALAIERGAGGDAWRTALLACVLALQEDRLPLLTARHAAPMFARLDSDGETVEGVDGGGVELPGDLPPGARMITIDDPAKLQELLEQMGVDGGDAQMIRAGGDDD